MLSERALKIALDLRKDYSSFDILGLIQEAFATSQIRGTNGYAPSVQSIVQKAERVLRESEFNRYPSDVYGELQEMPFASLLPKNIAQRILVGFSGNDPFHMTSSEVNSIAAPAKQFLDRVLGFVAFSNDLQVRTTSIADGSVAVDLVFPSEVYDSTFSILTARQKNFDRAFQAIAELRGLERRSPILFRSSTSLLTTSLLFIQEHGLGTLAWYGTIAGAASKTLELYRTIVSVKEAKMPAAVVRSMEESSEKVAEGYLEEAINSFVNENAKEITEERKNEIKNELTIASRHAVKDVMNGARIGLSIENFTGSNLNSVESWDKSGGTLLDATANLRQIEHHIQDLKSDGDQIAGMIENHAPNHSDKTN